jgi:hypothetical protein
MNQSIIKRGRNTNEKQNSIAHVLLKRSCMKNVAILFVHPLHNTAITSGKILKYEPGSVAKRYVGNDGKVTPWKVRFSGQKGTRAFTRVNLSPALYGKTHLINGWKFENEMHVLKKCM